RKVERRDAGDHAQRLLDREGVDIGGNLVGVLAFQLLHQAASVLNRFAGTTDFAAGVVEHLAVFGGNYGSQFFGGLDQLVAVAEQDRRALGQRYLRPAGGGLPGHGDDVVEIALVGQL